MLCLYQGEELAAYGFGQGHPFGLDRHDAFMRELVRQGLDRHENLLFADPQICSEAQLALFHSAEYIAKVKRLSAQGSGFLDCGDTPAYAGVFESASTVVGTVLAAVDNIMRSECHQAFIPIAGLHHARRDIAGGFCVFNDIGVAVEYLRRQYSIQEIAYIDIDAHHGDGVFYAFESDPDLFIVDFHEDGRYLYPGTGAATETGQGVAMGTKLNIPLPSHADDDLFDTLWPGALEFLELHPAQFYILQCGADSISGDPITHLQLSHRTHAKVCKSLLQLAEDNCDGRILALGGGGYNRQNLAHAWCAVVEQLLDTTE